MASIGSPGYSVPANLTHVPNEILATLFRLRAAVSCELLIEVSDQLSEVHAKRKDTTRQV
jgi:hypothetical protein